MADIWEEVLLEGSYSGERIDIMSSTTDVSRALVRHEYPHTNGADLEDMGRKARTDDCRLCFFPLPDDADPKAFLTRFNAFMDAVGDGDAHMFVHPLLGQYIARVESCKVTLQGEDRDYIAVDCTFVEDSSAPDVIEAGSGSPVAAAVQTATLASAQLDTAIADYNSRTGSNLSTDIGGKVVAQITSWQERAEQGLTAGRNQYRNLQLEMETLNNQINEASDLLEVTADPKKWGIYNAVNMLASSARDAFDAASATLPQLFDITVGRAIPLIVLAAKTYGAEEARARADELRGLNDIRNPASIPAGTTLKGYVPSAKRRRRAS